jgi:uncharacterized damage-inducible protein DinB
MNAEKLLKHMAWANQAIYRQVGQLPDAALDAFAVNPDWHVREIVRHMWSSATWYGYGLLDKNLLSESDEAEWQKILNETQVHPQKSSDVLAIAEKLAIADAVLFDSALVPESMIARENANGIVMRARSTIISQAIHHATEHRAQIVSALEAKGFTTINLDDYDLWAYSSTIGE